MGAALVVHRPVGPADAGAVDAELAHVETLDLPGLRLHWRNRFGRAAPANLPRQLLARLLAYRIQVEAHGGLSRESGRLLDRLADAKAAEPARAVALKPGTVLRREWQGRVEQVMATRQGFAWRDRMFPSLSAVATAITGTNWNGRRFFGLARNTHPERARREVTQPLGPAGVPARMPGEAAP